MRDPEPGAAVLFHHVLGGRIMPPGVSSPGRSAASASSTSTSSAISKTVLLDSSSLTAPVPLSDILLALLLIKCRGDLPVVGKGFAVCSPIADKGRNFVHFRESSCRATTPVLRPCSSLAIPSLSAPVPLGPQAATVFTSASTGQPGLSDRLDPHRATDRYPWCRGVVRWKEAAGGWVYCVRRLNIHV